MNGNNPSLLQGALKCDSRAFSLLEILLALTLFGVVMMTILDLWRGALRVNEDAEDQEKATLIAQGIVETLQIASPLRVLATGADWKSNPAHCMRLDLSCAQTYYLAYSAEGKPYRALSASDYNNLIKEKNNFYPVQIVITCNPCPRLVQVSISVATRMRVTDRQRHHREFVFLLSREIQELAKSH